MQRRIVVCSTQSVEHCGKLFDVCGGIGGVWLITVQYCTAGTGRHPMLEASLNASAAGGIGHAQMSDDVDPSAPDEFPSEHPVPTANSSNKATASLPAITITLETVTRGAFVANGGGFDEAQRLRDHASVDRRSGG